MSWSRFTDSDVYTFCSNRGLECCGCSLRSRDDPHLTWGSVAEFAEHLREHAAAGHDVDVDYLVRVITADLGQPFMDGITAHPEARGEQPEGPTTCPTCGSDTPMVCHIGLVRPHHHGIIGDGSCCCPDSWHGGQR